MYLMQETNLYTVTVPVFIKALTSLDGMLDKVAAYAAAKGTERRPAAYFENALLQSRLIADQFPFVQQVQVTCDNAKGATARISGVEMPKYEDNETTVAELKARVEKTIAFLKTITAEQIIGKEETKITVPYWNGKHLTAFEYVTEQVLPNFFFHLTTAYSILRSNGIDIGKGDFIGGLPLKD
ncbi:MAG: hypothetical protein JWM46_780 [Candidatus Kaiserbacteria bacterium]|nr:hypothetical protein [Candidatus Kaiserbacteria bacterium]